MKLNEVSSPRFGLILSAGDQSIDASDWEGMTEVYTNKPAFIKAIKEKFMDFAEAMNEDDIAIETLRLAKSIDDLEENEHWHSFVNHVWIDDRF